MNAHTKQQQDKVSEPDFIDSQKPVPTFIYTVDIYVYVCMMECKQYILGRPGFLGLNAVILSSFCCNAIIIVLRWFLFVKLVKPGVLLVDFE